MSASDMKTVIIDLGSWTTKVGFASGDGPSATIPTLVGDSSQNVGQAAKDAFDAKDAHCPLVDGYPQNFDAVEKLLQHVFKQVLSVDPSACNVLLTDSTTNPISIRKEMASLMFEKFNVPNLYIAMQSVLGMYSTGRLTGLVVDFGHVDTHVVPVYEGYCMGDMIDKLPVGGKHATDYLVKALQAKGVNSSARSFPVYEAAKIKEAVCRVAGDFDSEVKSVGSQEYTLPDGKKISVGKEALEAAEIVFQPKIADSKAEYLPLIKSIQTSVNKCDVDTRAGLKSAITLIGGPSMMPGLSERVSKDAVALLGGNTTILAKPQRANFSWIGGSLLGSLAETKWVTKKDYEDQGSDAIKKCPYRDMSICTAAP